MQASQDYRQLLTDVIKKQIVILGPDITLSKARNVKGLTVADDGTVTAFVGQPQEVTQALIDQFVQLSGLIVKKTMEPLLSLSQLPPTPQITPEAAVSTPTQPVATTLTTTPEPPVSMPATPSSTTTLPTQAMPQPTAGPTQPMVPTQQTQTPSTNPTPAKNPLAA